MRKNKGKEKFFRKMAAVVMAVSLGVPLAVMPAPAVQVQAAVGEYILEESSTRLLTAEDIRGLDTYWRQMAINEIYARHGRLFDWPDVQTYFDEMSWYVGSIAPGDFDVNVLSYIEQSNIMFLKNSDSSYILEDSSNLLLTVNEVNSLDTQNKQMAVNEIYARHGRIFNRPEVKEFFESKSWYVGTVPAASFDETCFSSVEIWNINFLSSNTYILPQSNQRYLTEDDVWSLNDEMLQMAINEIYARRGRKFVLPEVQEFFNGKSWYSGTIEAEAFDESVLGQTEAANIAFLRARISQEYLDWMNGYQTPVKTREDDGIRNICKYVNTVDDFQNLYLNGYMDAQAVYALPVYVWAAYPDSSMYYADFQEEGSWLSDGGVTIQILDCRAQPDVILEEYGTYRVYGRFQGYAGSSCITFDVILADRI